MVSSKPYKEIFSQNFFNKVIDINMIGWTYFEILLTKFANGSIALFWNKIFKLVPKKILEKIIERFNSKITKPLISVSFPIFRRKKNIETGFLIPTLVWMYLILKLIIL
jgi:hypothetical protein